MLSVSFITLCNPPVTQKHKKILFNRVTFWVFINEIFLNYFNIILNTPCKVFSFKICKEWQTLLELKAHLIKPYFQSLHV